MRTYLRLKFYNTFDTKETPQSVIRGFVHPCLLYNKKVKNSKNINYDGIEAEHVNYEIFDHICNIIYENKNGKYFQQRHTKKWRR